MENILIIIIKQSAYSVREPGSTDGIRYSMGDTFSGQLHCVAQGRQCGWVLSSLILRP